MSVYWLPYDTSEQITLIDSLVDSVHPFYNEKTILDGIKQNLIFMCHLERCTNPYLLSKDKGKPFEICYHKNMNDI